MLPPATLSGECLDEVTASVSVKELTESAVGGQGVKPVVAQSEDDGDCPSLSLVVSHDGGPNNESTAAEEDLDEQLEPGPQEGAVSGKVQTHPKTPSFDVTDRQQLQLQRAGAQRFLLSLKSGLQALRSLATHAQSHGKLGLLAETMDSWAESR